MTDNSIKINQGSLQINPGTKPQTTGTGGQAFQNSLDKQSSSLTSGGMGFGASSLIMTATTANNPQRMASAQGTAFGAGAAALPGMDSGGGGGVGLSAGIGGAGGASGGGAIGAAAGGGGQDQLLNATKQMQETQMSFNLQYLQLQSQMQHENRSYTAISNIMKTKHDTVKNSISNVR
ncbi:MAG: hypothetical protein IT381_23440 [Deltaproteobacteria bacterium]|nr:hypothetical protein [Deltaproteobacteria bacterium]